jgi:ParB-like chromosome segregation protein Spo0J
MSTIKIQYVPIEKLRYAEYNPRRFSKKQLEDLKKSILKFGVVDPLIVNSAPGRENIVIGGNFRLRVLKDLGYSEVPVVYVYIDDLEREKELNLRLNKNTGDWDWELLLQFDTNLLTEVGFDKVEEWGSLSDIYTDGDEEIEEEEEEKAEEDDYITCPNCGAKIKV